MIRVLVMGLTDTLGGVETYIYNLVKNTDREIIHFDFLCQGRTTAVFMEQIKEFYEGDVRFYFVPTYKRHFFKCIHSLKEIYRYNYDILYINACIATDVLYAVPLISNKNTEIVVHSHVASLEINQVQHRIFRRIVAGIPDLKLACSQLASKFFWPDDTDTVVVNNGIDTDRFRYSKDARYEIRDRYGLSDKQLVLGNIGRLTYVKNQSFILKILKNIIDRGIDAKLILVGDGEDRLKIEHMISEFSLNDHVVICGNQIETEKYYSAFDVFVMPSISEGFGIAAIEAQTSGLFCFLTNKFGNGIKVTDRTICLELFDDNHSEWADEIIKRIDIINDNRSRYATIVSEAGYNCKNTYNYIQQLLIQRDGN